MFIDCFYCNLDTSRPIFYTSNRKRKAMQVFPQIRYAAYKLMERLQEKVGGSSVEYFP